MIAPLRIGIHAVVQHQSIVWTNHLVAYGGQHATDVQMGMNLLGRGIVAVVEDVMVELVVDVVLSNQVIVYIGAATPLVVLGETSMLRRTSAVLAEDVGYILIDTRQRVKLLWESLKRPWSTMNWNRNN